MPKKHKRRRWSKSDAQKNEITLSGITLIPLVLSSGCVALSSSSTHSIAKHLQSKYDKSISLATHSAIIQPRANNLFLQTKHYPFHQVNRLDALMIEMFAKHTFWSEISKLLIDSLLDIIHGFMWRKVQRKLFTYFSCGYASNPLVICLCKYAIVHRHGCALFWCDFFVPYFESGLSLIIIVIRSVGLDTRFRQNMIWIRDKHITPFRHRVNRLHFSFSFFSVCVCWDRIA